MTYVVNLFGGPSVGKSSIASGTFFLLKSNHLNTELCTEYAKEKVWEDSLSLLSNQIYIFAKQHQRIARCLNKVDIIVTDSPINLGLIYGNMYGHTISNELDALIRYEFLKNDNINIVLKRSGSYDPRGRIQTFDEALEVDQKIIEILEQDNIPYVTVNVDEHTPSKIYQIIIERVLNKEKV